MAIIKNVLLVPEIGNTHFFTQHKNNSELFICTLCDTNSIKKEDRSKHFNDKHIIKED